ncbi:TetR/AcrR family transcriptional regulator [Lactococcus hircilactis]|nr:TetR/AcrR family transcriptional regulator [Lactococcus hircilactis]
MPVTSDSQRQLIEAFFRVAKEYPEQKMTFAMVAKRAGMSRENAYRNHFRGIPEIIERIHFLIDNEIRTDFEKFISSEDPDISKFFSTILPFLYEKQEWLRVLFNSYIDPNWLMFLQQKYIPLFTDYLDKLGKVDVFSNAFLSQIVVKEFLSIISTWLSTDSPEPPALFVKKFIHLLQQSPIDMLTQKSQFSYKDSNL